MRKKTGKKSEDRVIHKSKVLYKCFERHYETGDLIGPFSGEPYTDHFTHKKLKPGTARGFKSSMSVLNSRELKPCRTGYHAFTKQCRETWMAWGVRLYVYKVRLFNCFPHRARINDGVKDTKWLGTHFDILSRVSTKTLQPRRWRD